MSSTNNLDLSTVDTDDTENLANRLEQFYRQDGSIKSALSYNWERSHLYLDGRQWIVFSSARDGGGLWNRLTVSKQNEYIPRPVTNYLYDIYQTLKSYLIKNKPRSSVRANSMSYKDKQAAKLATLCLEANWVRLKEQYNYETAASNLITYGTVFKKSYWDTSSVSLVKVPKMQQVPQTDPTTGAMVGMQEVPVLDPQTGAPVFDELPLGDLNTYIVEPQRMSVDPLAMHLHEARWVMENSIQTLDWIKETFGKQAPGYTGLAEEVEEEKELSNSLKRWFQLRTSSGTRVSGMSGGGSESMAANDQMFENCAVVKEYYERPSAKYPKGRMVVVANHKTLYAGESPYSGPEMGDWHPYSECRWEILPGRFWGKSPLDDACEIQKRLNSIDSILILTRKSTAIPQWLLPQGCGIAPGSLTGRPGAENFYRADGTGAKPERLPGEHVDEGVFKEREMAISDLREITGAIDILRGDRPPGVTAASALNLLYEVGTGKLFPILDRWKQFVEQDQKKQLRIIAKFYREQRDDFVRHLRMQDSDLTEQDISNFLGTDLYDNCNVVVEAGSNIPKLQAAKQSMLVELAQMGALGLEQPANRIKFLDDMGIAGYDGDIGPDQKRAEWENSLMDSIEASPDNKPIVLAVDKHEVHIEVHSNQMKSPAFQAASQAVQQIYMQHLQEHEQMQAQAMQAQMLQAQATGQPAAPPQQGPHQPTGPHPKGSGMGKDLKNAVMGADVLTPASLGGQR